MNERKLKEIEEVIERKKAINEQKGKKKGFRAKGKCEGDFWRKESEKYEKKVETVKKIF